MTVPEEVSEELPPQSAVVAETDELRALVSEIIKQSSLGFNPAQFIKGSVTAISYTTVPPTLTINVSGDTTVAVSAVRFVDSYSPAVGDVALLGRQGNDIWALGKIASDGSLGTGGGTGWTQATLASGFSHNGDSQGDVEYRKVWDNGSWKMQWRGAAARSSGTTIVTALATDLRPGVKRNIAVSRGFGGGSASCQILFNTSGSVVLEASAITVPTGGAGGGSGFTSFHSGHSHPYDDYYDPGIADFGVLTYVGGGHDHSFTVAGASHTHSITAPDWVAFHGVEYFL